ncbi:hypothetical protein AMTR_s00031p00169000 [Amborella trichopoda]|uniref:Uncharacterized protein n=1 Tax=Amborella trichopoda TaxID=13333 RepID=U5CTH7_AMBTC|nr:hypothetical protein AMTR_s00031p00169000 [Amborella trichopoda]
MTHNSVGPYQLGDVLNFEPTGLSLNLPISSPTGSGLNLLLYLMQHKACRERQREGEIPQGEGKSWDAAGLSSHEEGELQTAKREIFNRSKGKRAPLFLETNATSFFGSCELRKEL